MLCSRCSEKIKPVVAVDIDGTLGDYHAHFIDFAEQYLGRNLPRARGYDGWWPFKSWFADACGVDSEEWRNIKLAYRQGGMKRSMPSMPGAHDLIDAIQEADCELWYTTTRPYLSLDNIVPDTVEWLRRHGLYGHAGLLFDDDKYVQLFNRVDHERVILVVDDLKEMCEAADALSPMVSVQASSRWNNASRFLPRAGLSSIAKIVEQRATFWKEQYVKHAAV